MLTLKAKALIERANVILYAGSLVNLQVLNFARYGVENQDTARLNLAGQTRLMTEAARAGKVVARLHTGDPAIFGAITEQMQALQQAGVPYVVIPGVSSAFAAAAALGVDSNISVRYCHLPP